MLTNIYLYHEPAAGTLDISALAACVESLLPGVAVEARTAFAAWHLSSLPPAQQEQKLTRLAEQFARAKIMNISRREAPPTPLPGEVSYESRRLSASGRHAFGLLYDGFEVMHAFAEVMPREERGLDSLHVVFTNQLLGTWEDDDRRYHARVAVFGYPCLLSTSGLVEAPARPREYYILKQGYRSLRMDDAAVLDLETRFKDRSLAHDDERLTEVMKGYVMQAVFYHLTGNPFCESRDCRLYNAHWQEEVIQAQLKSGPELCPPHEEELQRLRQSLTIRA
ncbi:MAG: hypothetical protein HW414_423 [Dehalococcoidia bacterium]|nr:hypothetical protein [Dehalococcoidia bacterium]